MDTMEINQARNKDGGGAKTRIGRRERTILCQNVQMNINKEVVTNSTCNEVRAIGHYYS